VSLPLPRPADDADPHDRAPADETVLALDVARAEAVRRRLGDVLVEREVVTRAQLDAALEAQQGLLGSRRRLGHVLCDLGFTGEREIAEALADALGLDFVDLSRHTVSPDVVRVLPRSVAERAAVLPLTRDGKHLTIAAADPTNVLAIDDVRLYTGASSIGVVVSPEGQVLDQLRRAWSLTEDSTEVTTAFNDAETDGLEDLESVLGAEDAPTVRLVSMVLSDAIHAGASDIHVEPQPDSLRIRYRVDGLLREVMTVPRSALASVVSRMKIISGLDIAERRVPQDGRTRISVDGTELDARVSTMPSIHGEKVVIRLLARAEQVRPLADCGLDDEQLRILRGAIGAPQGLILITGPTGSGKTSTLYSTLREIHTPDRNLVTLEDPVEIQLPGVTQTQVNERAGLTFSRGLRSVLRQDPDVVLVGEVRDGETAELVIKAAQTGHLVLSTLHTNNAVAAITRLVDLGVEPFLVASSLSCVVAQRLVRVPCASCAVPDVPSDDVLDALGLDRSVLEGATPLRGSGCGECAGSGYRGRTGVYEVVRVDQTLRRVLLAEPTESALAAATDDQPTLKHAALALALTGGTTFDEVLRVSPRD